ncbi:hypothetical protein ACPC54_19210 [Kitasatospora sp. NPDC094028]
MTTIRAGGARRRKPPAPGRRLLRRLGTLMRTGGTDEHARFRTSYPRTVSQGREPAPGHAPPDTTAPTLAAEQVLPAVPAAHTRSAQLPFAVGYRQSAPVQGIAQREAGDLTLDDLLADQLVRCADAVRRATRQQTGSGDYMWAEARLEAARRAVDLLVGIVADHGWPSYRLIGEEASSAALLIATEADPTVQVQLREALSAAVDRGKVPPGYFAFLDAYVHIAFGAEASLLLGALVQEQQVARTEYAGVASC